MKLIFVTVTFLVVAVAVVHAGIFCTICEKFVDKVGPFVNSTDILGDAYKICKDITFGSTELYNLCVNFVDSELDGIVNGIKSGESSEQLLYSTKNNMWSKSIVFVLLFAVTVVAQTNAPAGQILCTFCGWIVEDVQRQLNSSSFQDMSNRICQDVSFGLPQIEAQCLQFLVTQINVIISGLTAGNDSTSICKLIGSCGSQMSETQ